MSEILKSIQDHGTPIIKGNQVTFVWRGKSAPKLLSDWIGWDESKDCVELTQVEPGVWTYSCKLPQDGYFNYRFYGEGKFLMDPLNHHRVSNGLSGYNNYFFMPKAVINPWTKRHANVPHGTLSSHMIEDDGLVIGVKRKVILYQPPTSKPAPLLVVWDGLDYLHRGGIITIVENLMATRRIPPLALALVDNAHASRMVEYNCTDAAVLMLTQLVMPLAQAKLNLHSIKKHPGSFGVLGASMGGIMATYTGGRLPDIFGHVLSQSGAFILWDKKPVVWNLMECKPPLPLQIWLDIGSYDFLYKANQKFRMFLEQRGYIFKYQEYTGAHNYTCWHNELADGLIYQFSKG